MFIEIGVLLAGGVWSILAGSTLPFTLTATLLIGAVLGIGVSQWRGLSTPSR